MRLLVELIFKLCVLKDWPRALISPSWSSIEQRQTYSTPPGCNEVLLTGVDTILLERNFLNELEW